MKSYISIFQQIQIDESLKLLRKHWFAQTANMSENDFRSEVEKIAQMAELHRIEKVYDDTTNFHFIIVPRLQEWVNEKIFPRFIQAGLRKYAIIISQEMVAQLSIEQTMEEYNACSFQVKYFDNSEKAENWLLR
ncbi:hypothetical protein [Rhodoflexus caldus]|uniref:hypothetical protein n=1 Tax=Rhodoflexus caldus TaxID=2891236 RepID=UPI00202AA9D9|nr:hypothetical protein [Rhodoflexus caldus]